MTTSIARPARADHTVQPDGAGQSDPDVPEFTHRQILTIMSGLMLGMFLAALDQTIVSTSIRTIADDLNGLSLQAWVTTAYLITSTITTPLYGKLSDIFGRKPLFMIAISIFLVGSIASGFSQNIFMLSAFRAVQGVGAGGLMTLALAIIGDIVPPRERARYQGYFLAVFGTSSVAGPIIGGLLAGTPEILFVSGWRWVFLVNVPIGIFALFVVAKVLNLNHVKQDHRIDWQGALALMVGLVPLLLIAEQGRTWGWGSLGALTCYALGVIGIVSFIRFEHRAGDEALLPLRLFKIPTFSIASILGFIVGMAMFGAMMTLPLYLQIVKGSTPTESGLQLLPMVLGMMFASILSGQLTSKFGKYKIFPIIGTALLATGMFLMSTIEYDTSYWQFAAFVALIGLGLGLNMQTLTLAVQNAAKRRDIGVATSSATFFRQMGGTLGTAVFLSLLFGTVGDNIKDAFGKAAQAPEFQEAVRNPSVIGAPNNEVVRNILTGKGAVSGVIDDTSFINGLSEVFKKPFLMGFDASITHVVFIAGFVAILAFVVAWFLPQLELRTTLADAPATDGPQAPVAPEHVADAEPHAPVSPVDAPGLDAAEDGEYAPRHAMAAEPREPSGEKPAHRLE